ncbi:beta-ketoacyl-ACP synthase III [Clostridium thermobutyricum]|uniref:Beta-ketoacyl-[acyl-carrier-protein] synthase III n=1 Tax=Clostridium thermobutyricum DSM 4928 TaxID=1121339 RepID=A0A1V4SXR9_9CLOT|nr:beta-ketoacyl-ACP synthase III [Clostridium thermobutyricum]OPX48286.1 3-oxoacyl-[acyl-carrier-protein] synthase 3 [Clostridium thermobutyricum DSM 4928]
MNAVKIKSVGAYLPSNIITNEDISKLVETNNEWIVERTGIKSRRISKGEDTSSIANKAAKIALDRAKVKGEDIDLIIVATLTPDNFTPSVACIIQKEIGAENATAFDINAACTGFIYALEVGRSLMAVGRYKRALIIGAETLSKIVDWSDRSTCILFGDGGGACVLETSDSKEGIINSYSISDGKKGETLIAGAVDVNNPFIEEKVEKHKYIKMNGREVFKFATKSMTSSIEKVLENTEYKLNDIDLIIPHQANLRIIEYAAKKLNLPLDRFYINLEDVGNTSAGSIPIALNNAFEEGKIKKGMKIILVGFGGGLTCGSTLIKW